MAGALLDFWTIVRTDGNRLTLHADMKLPGEAWLDLRVTTVDGRTYIEQTAAFDLFRTMLVSILVLLCFKGPALLARQSSEETA